jgi:hypothetical protein
MPRLPATEPINVRRTERAASSRIALLFFRIEGPSNADPIWVLEEPLIAPPRMRAAIFGN